MTSYGIIPARLGSSRFPAKVIASVCGKPLVQYIWEAAKKSKKLKKVLIAVDSSEVMKRVQSFGAEAVMTPSDLPSGSDRVAFVAKDLSADIIVNLQADEPLLPADAIDELVQAIEEDPELSLGTLAILKKDPTSFQDPNIVKCVMDSRRRALYFSRKPLGSSPEGDFYKHVGIYAYRKEALLKLSHLPPSPLERTEKLEQLRALENGFSIGVRLLTQDTYAVDLPTDIPTVESILRALQGMVN
ncbi:MAG: 3-deoxy-manno-octulosonate cytidylyltransferase [Proteobacteria bacterium]|nr:3-deoxy-manno-octulosonate cytidylyltransferase [Pseudomonadota bacterium]